MLIDDLVGILKEQSKAFDDTKKQAALLHQGEPSSGLKVNFSRDDKGRIVKAEPQLQLVKDKDGRIVNAIIG